MIISTLEHVAGYQVTESLEVVTGNTIRAYLRNSSQTPKNIIRFKQSVIRNLNRNNSISSIPL